MPRATECVTGIELANALKKLIGELPVKVTNGDIGMRCKECGWPVKPQIGPGDPHFEHMPPERHEALGAAGKRPSSSSDRRS